MKKRVSAWTPIICVILVLVVSILLNYAMLFFMFPDMPLDQLMSRGETMVYDSNAKTIVHFLIELLPASIYACAVLWNSQDHDFFRKLANCSILFVGVLLAVSVAWFFIFTCTDLYSLKTSIAFLPGCGLINTIYAMINARNLVSAVNFLRALLWYLPVLSLIYAALSHAASQEP